MVFSDGLVMVSDGSYCLATIDHGIDSGACGPDC